MSLNYIHNQKVPFGLERWIGYIDVENYVQNAVEYLDDYIRVENIEFNQQSGLYFFNSCVLEIKIYPYFVQKNQRR